MPAVTGLNFILLVEDQAVPSTYNQLAGQKATGFNRGTNTADASDKDAPGWPNEIPLGRTWGFSAEGNVIEGDEALGDLEDAWAALTTIECRIQTPASGTYTGDVTVANISYSGPHDGILSYTIELAAAGVLTPA